ncbi:hypothetical protein LCGC14_1886900 [marine sediment metagenome]|uniref:CMP/dCMP-type deaminase domain-containing protein n=1 Tax=marine sediment metagenome TaxID=412755 RepID=A0A0F9GNY2_9ZZZZ
MLGPRDDFLNKDDTFMAMAILTSMDSKDPNTQVGACLVSEDNRVIGTGYNGFPRDIPSNLLPWDKEGSLEDTKYAYIGHAEENVVDNCDDSRIYGSRLYVTLHPCNRCAIRIIQNKIKEVIYLSDKYHDISECIAARRMFVLAGIKTRQFKSEREKIVIDFEELL